MAIEIGPNVSYFYEGGLSPFGHRPEAFRPPRFWADGTYDPNNEKDRVLVGVLRSHATERSLSIQPRFRSRHKKFIYSRMEVLIGLLRCSDLALAGVISPLL